MFFTFNNAPIRLALELVFVGSFVSDALAAVLFWIFVVVLLLQGHLTEQIWAICFGNNIREVAEAAARERERAEEQERHRRRAAEHQARAAQEQRAEKTRQRRERMRQSREEADRRRRDEFESAQERERARLKREAEEDLRRRQREWERLREQSRSHWESLEDWQRRQNGWSRQQYEAPESRSRALPKSWDYDQWRADCNALLARPETMRRFPDPPFWPCTDGCQDDGVLKACRHTIKQLLETSGANLRRLLKLERLRWHPDKFSKCPQPSRELIQAKATKMFQIIETLIQEC